MSTTGRCADQRDDQGSRSNGSGNIRDGRHFDGFAISHAGSNASQLLSIFGLED